MEKATITFEHADGRKITVTAEDKGNGETIMTTDFGGIDIESHDNALHSNLFLSMMQSIDHKLQKKNTENS